MSSNISIVKSTGWDAAIEDAKKHIERLRGVIAACEEKKPRENLGLEPLLRYMASRMPNLRTATQCSGPGGRRFKSSLPDQFQILRSSTS